METNKCKNCEHFSAYYLCGTRRFIKTGRGVCGAGRKLKQQDEDKTCDRYKDNAVKAAAAEESLLRSLKTAAKHIKEMSILFKERFGER